MMEKQVVKARRKAEVKLERDRLGKEHLKAMLDKSTTMLQAQQTEMVANSDSSSSGEEESEEESEAEEEQEQEESESAETESEVDSPALADVGGPEMLASPTPPPLRENGRRLPRSRLSESATPAIHDDAASASDADVELEDADDAVFAFAAADDEEREKEDEEMAAAMEPDSDDSDAELGGLADDADLPIEEIMRQAGYAPDGSRLEAHASVSEVPETEAGSEEEEEERLSLTAEEREADQMSAFGSDEDEARANEDEALEEAMEAEEMEGGGEQSDDSEMDGLAEEADLPIEELMRKYGYGGADGGPTEGGGGSPSVIAETEEGEEAQVVVNGFHKESTGDVERAADVELSGDVDGDVIENASEEEEEEEEASEQAEEEEESASEEDEETSERPSLRPPFLLRGSLRPYQQAGLEWLAGLYANGVNGLVSPAHGSRIGADRDAWQHLGGRDGTRVS